MFGEKRKLKEKYKRKMSFDEELMYFIIKIIGSTALFLVVAIGMDTYHLFH